jgi:hypothetical protein
MNRITHAPILAILSLTSFVAGCSPSEHSTTTGHGTTFPEALTASEARQAVLDLIRAHPETFVGAPDPDKLAQLPLKDRGAGEFTFGAFVVSTVGQLYTADIGHDAPEFYHYYGTIEKRDGKWVASAPDLQRFHRR